MTVTDKPEVAIANVRQQMQISVEDACLGKGKVACLVSGGLDSSTVAGLAARHSDVTAIGSITSPQYAGTGCPDEREWIGYVAARLHRPVEWVHPPPRPGPWIFSPRHFEWSPTPRLAPRHDLYGALLQRAMQCDCEILLDGSGGEIGPSARQEGLLLNWLMRGKWGRVRREILSHSQNIGLLRTIKRLLLDSVWRAVERSRRPVPQVFFAPNFQVSKEKPVRKRDPLAWLVRHPLVGLRTAGTKTFQSTGLNRTEVFFRRPLLSPHLMEYCAGLALELTTGSGLDRYIIREAAQHVLPPEIYGRTDKKAFSPDFRRRCQDTLDVADSTWRTLRKVNSVRTLLDVAKMDRILEACIRNPGLLKSPLLERTQATMAAAQFLAWQQTL